MGQGGEKRWKKEERKVKEARSDLFLLTDLISNLMPLFCQSLWYAASETGNIIVFAHKGLRLKNTLIIIDWLAGTMVADQIALLFNSHWQFDYRWTSVKREKERFHCVTRSVFAHTSCSAVFRHVLLPFMFCCTEQIYNRLIFCHEMIQACSPPLVVSGCVL